MASFFDRFREWFKKNINGKIANLTNGCSLKKKKILCIDDDRDFCRFMEGISNSLGLNFERAFSVLEAHKKIEENQDYFAYIIDGHLPDGSGFDLVKLIREQRGHSAPIGFVSRIYQDAVSFRILKENLQVDYVLEKPLSREDMELFLRSLCSLDLPKENHLPEEILDELTKQYQATIGEKIEKIEKLILTLQNNPSRENLSRFKNEVHKIAGSAGSYGYEQVSVLCADLDEQIKGLLVRPSEEKLDEEWLNNLDEFYSKIKLYFQIKK